MITKILFFLWCFVIHNIRSQINGEFWWLNEKVAKYNRALIGPPTIEHLSEFDTDDNTHVVFRDDNELIYSSQEKSIKREITTPKSARLSSGRNDNDLAINFVWPVHEKGSTVNNVTASSYLPYEGISTTISSKRNLDFREESRFVFPDSIKPKDKFEINRSMVANQGIDYITKPNNFMLPPVNHHSAEQINNKQHTKINVDDRPHFNNVNVLNIFETKQETNKIENTENVAPASIPFINNNNIHSSVFSSTINKTVRKINNSTIFNSNIDDRPKFYNVNVTNIIPTFYTTDNFITNQNYNSIEISPISNYTTHPKFYDKNQEIIDKPNISNAKVNDVPKYNRLWSTNEKATQLSNLKSNDDIIFFDEPIKTVTENIITNMPPSYKNPKEHQFASPRRDKIIWDYTSVPSRGSENIWNNTDSMTINFDKKPNSHNTVINIQNLDVTSTHNSNTTQNSHLNLQTSNPLIKHDDAKIFWNKQENAFVFPYPKKYTMILPVVDTTSTKRPNQISYNTNEVTINSKNDFSKPLIFDKDQVPHTEKVQKEIESQNICTYMEKKECEIRKGFVYTVELQIMLAKKAHDPNLICCILPSINYSFNNNYSNVNNWKATKREKRSLSDDINKELKQRRVIIQRYSDQSQNIRLSTTAPKIVNSDDEYVDPYLNIKNTNFQNNQPENSRKRYEYEDYIQDYADELPRPGLIGFYSEMNASRRPSSWTYTNRKPSVTYGTDVVYDSVESDETFGYSSVDPRKVVSPKPKLRRPQKLSTISDEKIIDPESQIITFLSNPDFHVFQGFKLLNLANIENKEAKPPLKDFIDKTKIKETEVKITIDSDSSESDNYDFNEDSQLFFNCGRSVKTNKKDRKDKQSGESDNGSHPWLGLVVETKRRFNILCYATIIHPRVAVTAAACVFGTSPGETTLIAGLWNLNERTRSRSRVLSILVHPEYEQGNLNNDFAILYWQQPLQLGINVQPACFASYDVEEECMFFGWGGFDQAIRPRSRWQKAKIEECKNSDKQNADVFCTSVEGRNSVVGVGSPLVCNIDGRQSMVGLVVSQDEDLVLLSPQEWVKTAVKKLLHI